MHSRLKDSSSRLIDLQYRAFYNRLMQLRGRYSTARAHDARVAARQLRSTLLALTPVLPKHATHRLKSELKRISDEIGSSRDARVKVNLLLPLFSGERGSAEIKGGEAQRLRLYARRTREHTHRMISSRAFEHRVQRMNRDVAKLIRKARSKPTAQHLVRSELLSDWSKLMQALKASTASPAALHALRIRAKKCRYLLNALPVDDLPADLGAGASDWLKRLQDCLGELHDIAQALAWLQEQSGGTLPTRMHGALGSQTQRWKKQFRQLRHELPLSAD